MKNLILTFLLFAASVSVWVYGALPADCVWEIRAACIASNYYGGMYSAGDAAGGGLDYSQQDNPQLTVTDAACANATNTTITSVTGGFTAAMKGNGLYLSGGSNLTAGWYTTKTYVDTNTITVDRAANAGGLDGTGGTVRLGGACGFRDAVFEAGVIGQTYYVKNDATHTLTEIINIAASTRAKITGYNASHEESPATGTDRPLIACGTSYSVNGTSYFTIKNLRFSGNYGGAICYATQGSIFNNLLSENSNNAAFGSAAGSIFINCAGLSTSSYAFGGATGRYYGCYAYDSTQGFYLTTGNNVMEFSIADNCTTGVYLNGVDYVTVANCTIYSGTTGIYLKNSCQNFVLLNTVISTCATYGIQAQSAGFTTPYIDYNDIYNCGTPYTNLTAGTNDYALDPGFVDPTANPPDFRVGANCKAKGFPGAIPGAVATCIGYLDTGAVQRVEPAASTGGGAWTW